ncbi:hypothetical protein Q604_UNBC16755G0001, partial [human gut metagenome]
MIIDGVKPNEENKIKEYSNKTFFILAIATS